MLFSYMKYPGIFYAILLLDFSCGVEVSDALLSSW